MFELVEAFQEDVDWYYVSASSNLPWHEQKLLQKWSDKLDWRGIASNAFLFEDAHFFDAHLDQWLDEPSSKFQALSYNHALPWSIGFIDRFLDYWDWEVLSQNPSLPWSNNFINNYENRLIWGGYEDQQHLKHRDENFLILGTFHQGLISNEGMPWSIDLLIRFEDELEFEMLSLNHAVWEKAFKHHVDDNMIESIIKTI